MATEAMLGSLMEPELDLEGVLWMRVVDIRFCLPSTHSFTNKTPISFWRTPSPTLSVYGLLSSCDLCLVNGIHCNWLQGRHVTQSGLMRYSLRSFAGSVGDHSC